MRREFRRMIKKNFERAICKTYIASTTSINRWPFVDTVFCPSLESYFGYGIHCPSNPNFQVRGPSFVSKSSPNQSKSKSVNIQRIRGYLQLGLYYYNILCDVLYTYRVSLYILIYYTIYL